MFPHSMLPITITPNLKMATPTGSATPTPTATLKPDPTVGPIPVAAFVGLIFFGPFFLTFIFWVIYRKTIFRWTKKDPDADPEKAGLEDNIELKDLKGFINTNTRGARASRVQQNVPRFQQNLPRLQIPPPVHVRNGGERGSARQTETREGVRAKSGHGLTFNF
jgi:hypothetical protein